MLNRQLPAPAVQLILAAFSFACFGVVAHSVVSQTGIAAIDADQAQRFWDTSSRHPEVRELALRITDLGSGRPRTVVVVSVAAILLWTGKCRLALIWAVTQLLVRY